MLHIPDVQTAILDSIHNIQKSERKKD